MMQRPYVIVNCAASIDGKIALAGGIPLRLSDEEDMARVHRLRNECDAILVGIGTVLADDPKLTVKKQYVSEVHQPLRVVLDSAFRTPRNAEVMNGRAPTLIVTTCTEGKRGNVEVMRCGKTRVDIPALLNALYNRGIKKVLIEGGSTVIGEVLRLRLVDKLIIFFSPVVIGGNAPSIVGGTGAQTDAESLRLEFDAVERTGSGFLVTARLKR
jgi:2,5-diamino-6-(ribosylamino)-4(3H)-pyrimidinone 5'-phosphate reductase